MGVLVVTVLVLRVRKTALVGHLLEKLLVEILVFVLELRLLATLVSQHINIIIINRKIGPQNICPFNQPSKHVLP